MPLDLATIPNVRLPPASWFPGISTCVQALRTPINTGFHRTLKSWGNLDCLLFSMPGYRGTWKFRKSRKKLFIVPVSGHLPIAHGLTLTACTVAGLGPSLLPDWLCRNEIDTGSLIDLFPDYGCTATEFKPAAWLVYPSRTYLPLKLRVFIEFLCTEVQEVA